MGDLNTVVGVALGLLKALGIMVSILGLLLVPWLIVVFLMKDSTDNSFY